MDINIRLKLYNGIKSSFLNPFVTHHNMRILKVSHPPPPSLWFVYLTKPKWCFTQIQTLTKLIQTAHSPNLYTNAISDEPVQTNTNHIHQTLFKPHSLTKCVQTAHSQSLHKQHTCQTCTHGTLRNPAHTSSTFTKHVHMAHWEILLIQAAPSPRLQGQHTHQSKYLPACGAMMAAWGWPSRRVPWLSSGCPPLHLYSSS